MKQLVVLGAGYGGLLTALKLGRKVRGLKDVEIVLVDRNDYHQFLHLSYEIVTGVKKPSDLTIPLAELLDGRRIRFLETTVQAVDLANKVVRTGKGELPYHKLVVALGSEPNYFHIKGAEENSLCVNSVEDAVRVRDELRRVLASDGGAKVVVGGGGFTGVELAGEIVEELRCCVTIVEGSKFLVPSWGVPGFSRKVAGVLKKMGAEFVFGKLIREVKPDAVVLNDGSEVECSLFIWTGGVQGSRVVSESGLKTGRGNRVVINEFCEAVEFPGVYVVGDCALVVDSKTGEILPQCIEVALQQAEVVAENLYADVTGGERTVHTPKFSGLLLAVGEKYAIGKVSGVKVEGRLAQFVKRLIHLRYVYEIAGLKEAFKESL